MNKTKRLIIEIKEIDDQKVLGFELKEISKDEAIIILNRCLFGLLADYDNPIKI